MELKRADDVCLRQRKQGAKWVGRIMNILSQKKCSLRNYYWNKFGIVISNGTNLA